MNFLDSVTDHYIHITLHVTQVFASCTHYTNYSLLNIVHVIVCVFQSEQPSLKLLWVLFVENIFMCLSFFSRENGWKSYSCIFISNLQCFEVCLQKSSYFSKHMLFQILDWSNLFFDQSKSFLKIFASLCLVWLIETIFRSIEHHELGFFFFFLNGSWLFQKKFFQKFFEFSLSLRFRLGLTSEFCRFWSFLLQGFFSKHR